MQCQQEFRKTPIARMPPKPRTNKMEAEARAKLYDAAHQGMTAVVRLCFGRGTSSLARERDRLAGSGLRKPLDEVRPTQESGTLWLMSVWCSTFTDPRQQHARTR